MLRAAFYGPLRGREVSGVVARMPQRANLSDELSDHIGPETSETSSAILKWLVSGVA